MSKRQKYMYGLSVQNSVVWNLLLKNQCLNNMFWNVAGGDFKQWTHVSDGNYVINLNTFNQLFWLSMDPLISFFFFLILSPLLCTLISSLLSSLCSPSCLRTHPKLSPQKLYWTHPPLITLTRPAIISLLSSLYLSFRSHPPHNSQPITIIFFFVLSSRKAPNPNLQSRSHAPPQ